MYSHTPPTHTRYFLNVRIKLNYTFKKMQTMQMLSLKAPTCSDHLDPFDCVYEMAFNQIKPVFQKIQKHNSLSSGYVNYL